jgi:hypothetical protein
VSEPLLHAHGSSGQSLACEHAAPVPVMPAGGDEDETGWELDASAPSPGGTSLDAPHSQLPKLLPLALQTCAPFAPLAHVQATDAPGMQSEELALPPPQANSAAANVSEPAKARRTASEGRSEGRSERRFEQVVCGVIGKVPFVDRRTRSQQEMRRSSPASP